MTDRQLAIRDLGAKAMQRSRAEAFAIARARVLDPNSKNTQRAYRQAITLWCAHCDAEGLPWAPISPDVLIGYLEHMRRTLGYAPNTVRIHLAALCALDVASRISPTNPDPVTLRKHQAVKRWERSWSRKNPRTPQRRAAAMEVSDLERLIRATREPVKRGAHAAHIARSARDRCLILFGVCGALRGDEVRRLTLADVAETHRGLTLTLRSSKTDQAGEGEWVGLMPQGRAMVCPIDAFHAWLLVRGNAPGPLFCGISRSAELELGRGLAERSIRRLIGTYAKRAGLELQLSAHSMRATLATLAASKGKGLAAIMSHGRWKSAAVAASYVRQGELFRDNVSSGLLD